MRCRALVRLVAAAAAVAYAGTATALDPDRPIGEYVHRTWRVHDGLPQATVTDLALAPDGYLVVSTFGGAARFDGSDFEPIGPDSGLPLRIAVLLSDRSGAIWLAPENGGLWRVPARGAPPEEVVACRSLTVMSLFVTAGGDVLVGTARGGALRLHGGDRRRAEPVAQVAGLSVGAIAEDAGGSLWFGTDVGVVRVSGEVANTFLTAEVGHPARITSELVRRDGSLWAAVDTNGIFAIDRNSVRKLPLPMPLAAAWITSMYEDKNGDVWLATTSGLYRWRHPGRPTDAPDLESLPGHARSVVEDGDGNLWYGTNADGLQMLADAAFRVYGTDEGLPNDQTLAVAVDRDGAVLVSLNCGPIMKVAGSRAVPLGPGFESFAPCGWSLLPARDGSLWVGTWGGGVFRHSGGKLAALTTRDGLGSNIVTALFQTSRGDVWAGTKGGGATVFPAQGGVRTLRSADGLAADDVRCFAEAPDGAIWIATAGGLSRWNGVRFANLTAADGLPSELVRGLLVERDGSLWAGTYGGGLALVRNGSVAAIGRAQGLIDDVVSWIMADGLGHLWLSGNRGIYRISRADLIAVADGRLPRVYPEVFDVEDGLRTAECSGGLQPAGARTADGRLWFPTIHGLAVVDPAKLPPAEARAAAVEAVVVDGHAVGAADRLRLPTHVKAVEVRYGAVDLAGADKLLFRYRLRGLSESWTDAGRRRSAFYGYLPPGEYRFEVQAFRPNGRWGAVSPPLLLEVPQVLWQRWWFLAAAVLLVGMAIHGIWSWRRAATTRREREHAEIARRLTAGILHEFRQPLQVVRTRIELLALRSGDADAIGADTVRALTRLEALLARLEALQSATPTSVRRYGGDEAMTDLDGTGRRN
jgi:ligand-binding sensor domain-containing protein